jgi:hypothetical protein
MKPRSLLSLSAICITTLCMLHPFIAHAQPWIYNFGTDSATYSSNNSSSTTFFSATPLQGGTYMVKMSNNVGGKFVLANPGTSLGSGSELQINASSSNSTNRFGIYNWNNPSGTAYIKFKLRTTSGTNGNLNISIGNSTLASNNGGYTTQYADALSSLTIKYNTTGAIDNIERRSLGSTVSISSSGILKDTDQSVEIYLNNTSSTASYTRAGNSYTLSPQQWDLWVDGTQISPANGWPKAGNLAADVNISGIGFFAESSINNSAFLYIDDIEYANALPISTLPASKLAITNISPATPIANSPFSVTVQSRDSNNLATNVSTNTNVTLSVSAGHLQGTTNGIINTQNNSVTFNGLSFSSADSNITLTATATSGDTLASGNSSPFSILAVQPDSQPNTIQAINRTHNSLTLSWHKPTNVPNGYLVLRTIHAGNTYPNTAPVDGTEYTIGDTLGNAIVAYRGNDTIAFVSLLDANVQYSFSLYSYNGIGKITNYLNTSPRNVQYFTLALEPTHHAILFTDTLRSATSTILYYSTPNNINADGYLILRQNEPFAQNDYPTDGMVYGLGSIINNGKTKVSFIITDGSSTNSPTNDLNPDSLYYYILVPFNGSGITRNYKTDGLIPSIVVKTPSNQTDVISIVGSEALQISSTINDSLITNSTDGVQVWQMMIRDGGAAMNDADTLPTRLTSLTITRPITSGMDNYANAISAIALFDGSTRVSESIHTSINSTNITFSNLNIMVADNTSKILSVRLSLKSNVNNGASTGSNADGDDFVFQLSAGNIITGDVKYSSQFSFSAQTSKDSANIYAVEASKLAFITQPTDVNVGVAMQPAVNVEATDAGNNRDLHYNNDVSLQIAQGNAIMHTGAQVAAVKGLATFSNLTLSNASSNNTLIAYANALTSSHESHTFDVRTNPAMGFQLSKTDTAYIITFENSLAGVNDSTYTGTGITPNPNPGQLNSQSWAITGFTDGVLNFGDTKTTGDFAQGKTSTAASTAGLYAFVINNNTTFGIQPTDNDFTPGHITFRFQNNTGVTIDSLIVAYKVYIKNNENRSSTFNFSHSPNHTTYQSENSLDLTSESTSVSPAQWLLNYRVIKLINLNIAPSAYYYIRWSSDDNGGSGSRDELALDDITLIANPLDVKPTIEGIVNSLNVAGPTLLTANTSVNESVVLAKDDLDINNKSLTINGSFQSLSGTIRSHEGSLIINGSNTNTSLSFDQREQGVSNVLNTLTLNNMGGNITLNNPLVISNTFIPSAGNLNANGNLIIQSTALKTARIEAIQNGADIIGDVVVQRHLFGGVDQRGWRLLGSPIRNFTFNQLIDDILITGSGGALNGFDADRATSSVCYHEESANAGWKFINSISDSIPQGKGMLVFFRGDRSQTNALTNTSIIPNDVTLDFVGPIHKNNLTVSLDYYTAGIEEVEGYNLIGNPYPSSISWSNLNMSVGVDSYFWLLNPATGNYVIGTGNQDIALGQSFFVKVNQPNQSISFTESCKSNGNPVQYFKTAATSIGVKMQLDSTKYDIAWLEFKPGASRNYVFKEDGLKMSNSVYNLYFVSPEERMLQYNVSAPLSDIDTFYLAVTSTVNSVYTLNFEDLHTISSGKDIYLKDLYLDSSINLLQNGTYQFSINNNITASVGKRFMLLIGNSGSLPVTFIRFTGKQKGAQNQFMLTVGSEKNVLHYELQRSSDFTNFSVIETVPAQNQMGQLNYYFADNNPLPNINYYRIKAIDRNGDVSYTNSLLLQYNPASTNKIYPNPTDGIIFIDETDFMSISIKNLSGKLLLQLDKTNEVNISHLENGMYILELTQNNETQQVKIIKQ